MCIVFVAMLTTVLLALTSFAAEGTEPKPVKLEGSVSVSRDANDVITAVQLVADADTYNVVLDAKGLALGEEMEDEKVEVEGTVTVEKETDQKWLKVLTFKEIEEEEQ